MKEKTGNAKAKQTARAYVRKRNEGAGEAWERRYSMHIRMKREVSKELASMQGLCLAHGKRETLADLFEEVAMPALRRHVRRYAQRAAKARQSRKAVAK